VPAGCWPITEVLLVAVCYAIGRCRSQDPAERDAAGGTVERSIPGEPGDAPNWPICARRGPDARAQGAAYIKRSAAASRPNSVTL